MPNIVPYSNFHELNLDWILMKLKELENTVAGITGSTDPSDDPPEMDGTADPGSSANYSRGNHVHPTDTSRASQADMTALQGEVYNNYQTLSGEINTLDAKVAFSAAAPLMDSSSPSSGSSAYQARADHVHPTDTSRASASDLTALQQQVNAISAATPSNTAPLMDSTATPGTSALYARGDHVHPTDTSRASVAALNTLSQAVAAKSNILAVETLDFGDITTNATTYRASVNAAKAGYTFLGFLGYKIADNSGKGASTCHVYEMTYTNNNEAQIVIAQSGSLTLNINISAQALYIANS